MQTRAHNMDIPKNDFLVALCNNIKEGAAIIEKSTNIIVFCNEPWLNMFALKSGINMGPDYLLKMRKDKLSEAEMQHRTRIAEEKGLFTEQVEYKTHEGHSFWGELSVRFFQNKGEAFYLITIDRIDKVKDNEQKIEQERKRFDALLEHVSMGILETNKFAEIININQFALNLFGYNKDELLFKKIELLIPARFHDRHVGHRDAYINYPKNRPMGVGMDLFAVKKDGTEFPVEVSLSHYIRDGEQCVIAFISDISIRKKSEMEIKKLNDELEEVVEQRTKELKQAIHDLQLSKEELSSLLEKEKELSELKSRFVSMASHEFRTPLSTVLSSVYLLQQYKTTEDEPKREKHFKRIISSVNMLTDILNDFLSVGKIEEGKIYVRYSEFDIQKLVASIAEELRNNLKKGQTIRNHHEGNPFVLLDLSLFKHIVMNLVSNASKFSPDGSLIEIKTVSDNEQVILSVKDYGMGISQEDQKHLKERFFRGANAANIQGTGLGLHIISKYAELMNGIVECRSELGRCTEFIVTLNT